MTSRGKGGGGLHLSSSQLEEIFCRFRDSLSKKSNDNPPCILIPDPHVKVHLGKRPNPESHQNISSADALWWIHFISDHETKIYH